MPSDSSGALALKLEPSPSESVEAIGELGAAFLVEQRLQEHVDRESLPRLLLRTIRNVVSPSEWQVLRAIHPVCAR